ncbi:MAG: archease [Armatimonadota bacterium]|nr:archease [bacterium]
MKHEHKFEIIEHTADVGVIGKGATKAEAFENAAYGMFSITADLSSYQATDAVEVTAEGDDDITLLERFLSSMLVIFDGDGLLPLDFDIVDIQPEKLTCRVSARKISDDIEWLGPTIKAVTYHQMSVDRIDDEWQVRVIFDV